MFLGLDIRKVQRVGTLPSIPPVVNFNRSDPSVACRRGLVVTSLRLLRVFREECETVVLSAVIEEAEEISEP
jgi:hypothetical protein